MSDSENELSADELSAIEVSAIYRSNLSFFAVFIPQEFWSRIESGALLALGAISEGTACAALVAEEDGTELRLLSVCVAPEYRRQYIASTLIGELLDFINETAELELQSLTADYADNGSGVRQLLDKIGFSQEIQEDKTLSISAAYLPNCKFMQQGPVQGVSVVPLKMLSDSNLRRISSVMDRYSVNFLGEPLSSETVITELSFAAFQNQNPIGCVCLSKGTAENVLELTVFFITEKMSAVPMYLLHCAADEVLKSFPKTVEVRIPVVTESAGKLVQALTDGKAEVCERMYTAVLEI